MDKKPSWIRIAYSVKPETKKRVEHMYLHHRGNDDYDQSRSTIVERAINELWEKEYKNLKQP